VSDWAQWQQQCHGELCLKSSPPGHHHHQQQQQVASCISAISPLTYPSPVPQGYATPAEMTLTPPPWFTAERSDSALQPLHVKVTPSTSVGQSAHSITSISCGFVLWLNGLVVRALEIRTRGPRLDSRVAPLFHWVATLGKLFTHTLPPHFFSSKKLGYKREFSAPKWLW